MCCIAPFETKCIYEDYKPLFCIHHAINRLCHEILCNTPLLGELIFEDMVGSFHCPDFEPAEEVSDSEENDIEKEENI